MSSFGKKLDSNELKLILLIVLESRNFLFFIRIIDIFFRNNPAFKISSYNMLFLFLSMEIKGSYFYSAFPFA